MKTQSIQIALFLGNTIGRPDLKFYEIDKYLGSVFDNAPNNFPLPPEAPDEIPRLQATSKNGQYILTIFKNRIDLAINILDKDINAVNKANQFYPLCKKFIEFVLLEFSVIRVGMVSQNILKEPNSVDRIRKKYFQSNITKPYELSFRMNNRHNKYSLIINDITEIASAEINELGNVYQGIIINRDINNMPILGNVISKKSVNEFVDDYYQHLLSDKVKELI